MYVAIEVFFPQTEKSTTTAHPYRGIDYFLRQITITSRFRLSLRFEKFFDRISHVLRGDPSISMDM